MIQSRGIDFSWGQRIYSLREVRARDTSDPNTRSHYFHIYYTLNEIERIDIEDKTRGLQLGIVRVWMKAFIK